jgi:hypothetical protein
MIPLVCGNLRVGPSGVPWADGLGNGDLEGRGAIMTKGGKPEVSGMKARAMYKGFLLEESLWLAVNVPPS